VPLKWVWFLPPALSVGWVCSRTALDIHRTKGRQGDMLLMLALGWSPLLSWLLALLLSLLERNP